MNTCNLWQYDPFFFFSSFLWSEELPPQKVQKIIFKFQKFSFKKKLMLVLYYLIKSKFPFAKLNWKTENKNKEQRQNKNKPNQIKKQKHQIKWMNNSSQLVLKWVFVVLKL